MAGYNDIHFTLTDYNFDVLRLVTIPNLLLSWAKVARSAEEACQWMEESDLEVTPELLTAFQSDLQKRRISVAAISGAWGEPFTEILLRQLVSNKRIILASETIYSPASLDAFGKVLYDVLQQSGRNAKALVAAKKVYFGVGGSVDDFIRVMDTMGCETRHLGETVQGVGRVLLETRCR